MLRFAKKSFLDNILGKLIFAMGITSSLVTQLCTIQYLEEDSNNITIWYNMILGFVTVFCVVFGYAFLFVKPNDHHHDIGSHDIGSHDKGMGLVLGAVSALVVGLEIILIIMVNERKDLSIAFGIYLLVFAVEKIVQVVVYLHIRRLTFDVDRKGRETGAAFYFSFLSFINFTLWLNSIPFADIPIYDKLAHEYEILQYVDETFKALIIDYRLLCALLFLEHAIQIGAADRHQHNVIPINQDFEMPKKRYLCTVVGLSIGLVFLALEIVYAAQFWGLSVPKWVNIFPILVDVGLAVLALCLLLNSVEDSFLDIEKISPVTIMVSFMGAASIIYLITFGLLSLISFKPEEPDSYVTWSAFVFFARGISLFVLLIVYTRIPVKDMKLSQFFKTENYLLVSALCSGLFARFVGNIFDEFQGTMHKLAHHYLQSKKLRPLRDLFAIGPLFQLAASLHLALHFLLFIWRLRFKPTDNPVNGEPARSDGTNGIVEQPPSQSVSIPNSQVMGERTSGFESSAADKLQSYAGNDQIVAPDPRPLKSF